jgi:hypothetical protein
LGLEREGDGDGAAEAVGDCPIPELALLQDLPSDAVMGAVDAVMGTAFGMVELRGESIVASTDGAVRLRSG